MNQPTTTLTNRLQRGFTMVELMIALVVLSIGLLSLAGLQATGLRNNHSAYLRSQATLLAYDVIDRMRANRSAAVDGDYNITLGAAPASATTQAYTDLQEWFDALDTRLPSGEGGIDIDVAENVITVQVRWDDSRGETDFTSFTLNTRL